MNKFESDILKNIRNNSFDEELNLAKEYALDYIKKVDNKDVFPKSNDLDNLCKFDEDLSYEPTSTKNILEQLATYGSPATVANTGRRYFGFVFGGILPGALCSKYISDAWDQNPGLFISSPISSKLEEICEKWLIDLFNLPKETVAGFVSGSSTAIICSFLAARYHLLKNMGYDVNKEGLINAPEIKVVLGEEAHSCIFKALSIVGLNSKNLIKVPCDNQGRICVDKIPDVDDKTLLILQAGNLHTGNFDNFEEIFNKVENSGAWVHIDGAFGLWAACCDKLSYLTKSFEKADSWSVDSHKTLNAPYDNGIVLCKHKNDLVDAMHMSGSYLSLGEHKDGMFYTMEMSRRARATDLWATLKSLGKRGVSDLVYELHCKAAYFAKGLKENNFEILNDVVYNQFMFYFQDDNKTKALLKKIQDSGVCWLGGSYYHDKFIIRVSVCSYKTTYEDIDFCINKFIKLSKEI